MTTTITLPRAAAQQALEALEFANVNHWWGSLTIEKAITALRAALAQQAKPVAYTTGHCENHKQKGGCQLHNLQCGWPDCDRKPSAAPPQQAEPVEGNTLLRDFLAAAKEAGVTHIRQVEADLCSALAQQAEPVEPVAWMHNILEDNIIRHRPADLKRSPQNWTPLCNCAQPQQSDTDCHTQGICQRSGYGIPKP